MTDRRTIRELRAHADKVSGYGHLVTHEMVDEIEELRRKLKIAEGESELYKAQASVATGSVAEVRKALGIGPNTYCPDHIRELIAERDSLKRVG